MTRTEHLLIIIMEECNEIAQRASKALRFTLDEIQPGQDLSNEARIWQEYDDLRGAMQMLAEQRKCNGSNAEAVSAKMRKIEKFLDYSNEIGTLE